MSKTINYYHFLISPFSYLAIERFNVLAAKHDLTVNYLPISVMDVFAELIDAFLARGVLPKHLFLAGHSNGAWTSLMMMRDLNKRFNGAIAFAPAFAGKRSEVKFAPWWRRTVRPRQIKEMLMSPEIDALVFGYENDPYNRPQELQFLADNYPLVGSSGVDLVTYDCGLRNAHQTFRKDCRKAETTQRIQRFINKQIATWK